jgi:hypothetical protein
MKRSEIRGSGEQFASVGTLAEIALTASMAQTKKRHRASAEAVN